MPLQLGSAYGSVEISTGSAQQNITSLADSMRRVGTTMSLAVSAPMLAVGTAGLKAAAGFEQSMNQIQVVSSATAAQMNSMSGKALQLGRDTSFSAGEAAEGLLELAKAGMSADQSIAAIGGVLDLAAAGNLSVAQAAEISANALNAFNLPASDAARVADLLAAAANSSSIEVTDMAQAFAMSSAVFSSNQQSIEDLSTAIAILGNNGLKGSDAGTSLKTMLMRLTAPTGEAATAMSALGIQVYNADGSMKSFQNIVGQLESSTKNLTQEQKNQALTTIFGADAIRAANILIKEGATEFDNMKDSVQEAGAAQLVADARMKGLAGAVAYAKGTIESTLIAAFLPLTETLGNLIRKGADLIGRFAALPEPIRNAALAFGAVLAVAGPILVTLPMIGAALAALLSPIGLIMLAVAGLAAAWAADFGGIQAKTQAVIDFLQPALDRLKAYLEMIKGGNWSGLANAVFADVGAMLTSASTTIAAFDWADWIDGALDWGAYIGQLAWDGFLTLLDWQVYVWKLEWSLFVKAIDWAGDFITSLDWASYVTAFSEWSTYVQALAWESFVSALTWGAEYIASLDWAAFVSTLSDWGQWIANLDWTKIITTVIDWATWIPALTWNSFVKMLDWITIVAAFVWSEWISKLSWSDFVAALEWGTDTVSKLSWSDFVAALDWAGKIAEFAWDSFVSKLDWPLIAEFDWAGWIDSFNWPRLPSFSWSSWISSFRWPSLPSFDWSSWISGFSWPSLPSFNWSDWIPELKWPSIPEFKWPTITLPSIPGFAVGTAFAPGGMALVGERGPELIDLPRGSRVYDNQETQRMGGGATTINNYYQVADALDVESVAYRVAQVMQRRGR